jgi:tRNA nucleotidyltransferase/poly(A) polymerase
LYLDFNCTVTDYFNGIEDLKNKKLRFIGDANIRIKEDAFRILRYLRMFGRIADDKTSLYDEDTFNAIKNNGSGLACTYRIEKLLLKRIQL